MIEAQYRLVTEGLKVDHLRLVMGTSMGGMHTWLWGEIHPEFMDALMPLASLPTQISGRNRAWRRVDHRRDPQRSGLGKRRVPQAAAKLEDGCRDALPHVEQPGRAPERGTDPQMPIGFSTTTWRGRCRRWTRMMCSTRSRARRTTTPAPGLERITAPLLAINFEDDLINPPELDILEREIRLVKRGKAIVIPRSDRTRGPRHPHPRRRLEGTSPKTAQRDESLNAVPDSLGTSGTGQKSRLSEFPLRGAALQRFGT